MILRKKPVVLVSLCLGFGVCRWNGAALDCRLVDELRGEVDFIPVCPECEIGLGMPRPPIRLVQNDSALALVQPETGLNLTAKMINFTEKFLQSLGQVDGFILKRKSPSCGLVDIPVYATPDAKLCLNKNGSGFFARAVCRSFPDIPKVDEECPDKESFLGLLR